MAQFSQLMVMTFGSTSLSDASGHPNKMKLRGVLVRLNEPSTKAPNGSDGHRIMVPGDVAQKRLHTLVGMGLNYAPSLEQHAQRRKVGVITRAWIEGNDLCVEATVWKHDFPEAERDLKQKGLGMSMEIGDVQVKDPKANIWELSDLCFLGATVLWKDSAAYYRTQAIAANKAKEGSNMEKKKVVKKADAPDINKIIEIASAAAAKAVTSTLGPTIGRQTKILAGVVSRLDKLEVTAAGSVITAEDDEEVVDDEIEAGSDEEEACDDEMKSSKHEDHDDDDDDDDDEEEIDSAVDRGDLEELGSKLDSKLGGDEDEDDPGHLSEDAKNKGRKTTSEDKMGKTVASAREARLLKQNKALARQVAELTASQKLLNREIKKTTKQVKIAAAAQGRKSMDAVTAGLLAKNGINVDDMVASGTKLTVAEVDAVLEAGGLKLGITERMTIKNNLLQGGLMEMGAVNRGLGIN